MYDHGILKKPNVRLEVDKGVEFKNQVIGTLISQLQVIDELRTGQTNKSWVRELQFMIKKIIFGPKK